jgi:hypothetical protein
MTVVILKQKTASFSIFHLNHVCFARSVVLQSSLLTDEFIRKSVKSNL